MQALRRRARDAERQVLRRQSKRNAKRRMDQAMEENYRKQQRMEVVRGNLVIDRKEKWEQWYLGPLRTGGVEGIGKKGDGAGGLFKRTAVSPELLPQFKKRREMAKEEISRKIDMARKKRVDAGGPRGKARMEMGPQDLIVVSDL